MPDWGLKPQTAESATDSRLGTEASDRQQNAQQMPNWELKPQTAESATDDQENRQSLRQETLEHGRRRRRNLHFFLFVFKIAGKNFPLAERLVGNVHLNK
ncbi:hypothetical protein BsWGS_12574 [Bradybaena similaris]